MLIIAVLVVVFIFNRGEGSGPVGAPSGEGAFENTSPVAIEDQGTVESTIEVTGVEGNAPTSLGVHADISHSYIGDVEIELISPDGSSFYLDAVEGPHLYTVDASSATASGTWTLRLQDTAPADTGTLESWALQF